MKDYIGKQQENFDINGQYDDWEPENVISSGVKKGDSVFWLSAIELSEEANPNMLTWHH